MLVAAHPLGFESGTAALTLVTECGMSSLQLAGFLPEARLSSD